MDIVSSNLNVPEDRLYEYAASSARLLRAEGAASAAAELRSMRADMRELRRFRAALARRAQESGARETEGEDGGAAGEWLLDNFYLAEREYISAAGELSRARLAQRRADGVSLGFALCRAYLRSGGGRHSEERLQCFLDGFQSVCVLTQSELESLGAMLRAAVISALREVCRAMDGRGASGGAEGSDGELAALLSRLFGILRRLPLTDMDALCAAVNVCDHILALDPTGEYPRMDAQTKRDYLRALARRAARAGVSEQALARELTERAREKKVHVGEELFGTGASGAEGYVAFLCAASAAAALAALFLISPAAAALLLIPLAETVKSLCDLVLARFVRPRRLPRMELKNGIPPEGKTMCVISALLCGGSAAREQAARLERLYHACGGQSARGALSFALLCDLPPSKRREEEGDAELIASAESEIAALNAKYGGGFCLLTRERSRDGDSWCGRERKRGALCELARLLVEGESALEARGDTGCLKGSRFILTLDADTVVYPGSVRELIAAAIHPLGRARIDPARGAVTAGHGIFHPRVSVSLSSAGRTDFSLIAVGAGGSDPYGAQSAELYMDAFSSGGFAGKGLIDAEALLRCTAERLDGRGILSHDAPEGAYLRGAFMGEEEFFDDFPASPLAYFRRMHRWVRGDWQNLGFIFSGELAAVERQRMLDKLRRSLVPAAALAALLYGFIDPRGGGAAAAAAALCLSFELIPALGAELRRRAPRGRRAVRLLVGFGGSLLRCFVRLWLLPWEAWVCLSAAATALWRKFVTHRGLLRWETAAQSERGGALGDYARAMLPAIPAGLAALSLSQSVIGRAAGLMWLLSPLAAWALGLAAAPEKRLGAADRAYIRTAAEDTWRYFSELSRKEDNYLPPDNWQSGAEDPAAHTVSPTNLGFALLAPVAACDLGFIDAAEAAKHMRRVLGAAERMERFRGHFYNWYDTRTLKPLAPRFISSVDSGNLCAALICAAAFASEQGFGELEERMRRLYEEADPSFLYDERRALMCICWDAAKDRAAGGWYDLMASEASLSCYIACARGAAPRRLWRALGRAVLRLDGYGALASWTGSMFEYLMSAIFLPPERGSLLYESARSAVRAQRLRAPEGLPWGCSESAYFSLDPSRRWRYKAHGVSSLALRRGMDDEFVVSPYSSFLALPIEPGAAAANLRSLERLGMRGRFGFFEALDFTPGRCARGREGERVGCFMAHHEGMSLAAAANALCSGSIARRFMSNAQMAAFLPLVRERGDSGAELPRRPEAPAAEPPRGGPQRGRRGTKGESGYCLLCDGTDTMELDERGPVSLRAGGTAIADSRFGALGLCVRSGGTERTLLPSLADGWDMSAESCGYSFSSAGLRAEARIRLDGGALIELDVRRPAEGEAELRFVPLLAPAEEYLDHPAFIRLGISARTEGNCLLLRRVGRGGRGDLFLAVSCSAPCSMLAEDGGSGSGTLLRPRVRMRAPFAAGGEPLRFAICCSGAADEAIEAAKRLLVSTPSGGGYVGACASMLGMSAAAVEGAWDIARAIRRFRPRSAAAEESCRAAGVTGVLPLLLCRGGAKEEDELLSQFCLLKSCGTDCELAVASSEAGEYDSPAARRLLRALSRFSLEPLYGAAGGVRPVAEESFDVLATRAAWVCGAPRAAAESLPAPEMRGRGGADISCSFDGRGTVSFTVPGSLPKKPWQNVLFAHGLGWLVSECGSGYMWLENAREGRVSPPPREPESPSGAEALWAETPRGRVSLFAAEDAADCRVEYSGAMCRWTKSISGAELSLTGFIDPSHGARLLLIEGAEGLTLCWRLETVLGTAQGAAVDCSFSDGFFRAANAEGFLAGRVFTAAAGGGAICRCDWAEPGFMMTLHCGRATVLGCGFCDAAELRALLGPEAARGALAAAEAAASAREGRFRLSCSDARLEHYMNFFCLRQIYARIEARTSLYQSGGAYGFRDQLQDAVSLLAVERGSCEARILDCCRHQYPEGDVMHWWHPAESGDTGVRTRCADDLLWLPWALGEYWAATGEIALCRAEEPFVVSLPLGSEEKDRYERPAVGEERASVLDHALLALRLCEKRGVGGHGLPLALGGDWNDALGGGECESVWLGFFLCYTARSFSRLLDVCGRESEAEECRALAERTLEACEGAFNGRWYERCFPLRGERIDSTVQSWAVFCGAKRAREALDEALCRLVDARGGVVKLLDPPYGADGERPGYIAAYGEGCRENGGQYTHAAVWLARACFRAGRPDAGYEILALLLPDGRGARYGAEPYVLAADVCAAPGHVGEAGWSWYTGSAGWFFRTVCEDLLGLKRGGSGPTLSPADCALFEAYGAELDGETASFAAPDGGKTAK